MKRLHIKCPTCGLVFPSGFCTESPTQLIDLNYLCPKCRSIVPSDPPDYLEYVGGKFRRAMKKEEVFAFPYSRIELSGPDIFELTKEVRVPESRFVWGDKAIIMFREKSSDER